MSGNVLISGGTGFIGSKLIEALKSQNYHISVFTRDTKKACENFNIDAAYSLDFATAEELNELISSTDYIINLAGAPVAEKRLTPDYKKMIMNSRINTTRKIVKAIKTADRKPISFISASAVGFYGDRGDEILTENSGYGSGFLAEVCKAWENEAMLASEFTNVIIARIGFVLDSKEGGLSKLCAPYKFGVGGVVGSGEQYVPWIHIEDIIRLFIYVLENKELSGVFNFTAPNPVKMKEFSKNVGLALNKPAFFKTPSILLKLVLGETAEIILAGQRAVPEKALNLGFEFKFDNVEKALKNILSK